jgi:hypothetical protein
MHWLFLVVSILLLLGAMKPTLPGWVVFLMLLGSLGFIVAWILGWLSSRISSGSRHEMHIISPDELRQLREQAEARKAAAAQDRSDPPA